MHFKKIHLFSKSPITYSVPWRSRHTLTAAAARYKYVQAKCTARSSTYTVGPFAYKYHRQTNSSVLSYPSALGRTDPTSTRVGLSNCRCAYASTGTFTSSLVALDCIVIIAIWWEVLVGVFCCVLVCTSA